MGADEPAAAPPAYDAAGMGSSTTWVAGGLLIGLAAVMLWEDKKDPLGFKKAS